MNLKFYIIVLALGLVCASNYGSRNNFQNHFLSRGVPGSNNGNDIYNDANVEFHVMPTRKNTSYFAEVQPNVDLDPDTFFKSINNNNRPSIDDGLINDNNIPDVASTPQPEKPNILPVDDQNNDEIKTIKPIKAHTDITEFQNYADECETISCLVESCSKSRSNSEIRYCMEITSFMVPSIYNPEYKNITEFITKLFTRTRKMNDYLTSSNITLENIYSQTKTISVIQSNTHTIMETFYSDQIKIKNELENAIKSRVEQAMYLININSNQTHDALIEETKFHYSALTDNIQSLRENFPKETDQLLKRTKTKLLDGLREILNEETTPLFIQLVNKTEDLEIRMSDYKKNLKDVIRDGFSISDEKIIQNYELLQTLFREFNVIKQLISSINANSSSVSPIILDQLSKSGSATNNAHLEKIDRAIGKLDDLRKYLPERNVQDVKYYAVELYRNLSSFFNTQSDVVVSSLQRKLGSTIHSENDASSNKLYSRIESLIDTKSTEKFDKLFNRIETMVSDYNSAKFKDIIGRLDMLKDPSNSEQLTTGKLDFIMSKLSDIEKINPSQHLTDQMTSFLKKAEKSLTNADIQYLKTSLNTLKNIDSKIGSFSEQLNSLNGSYVNMPVFQKLNEDLTKLVTKFSELSIANKLSKFNTADKNDIDSHVTEITEIANKIKSLDNNFSKTFNELIDLKSQSNKYGKIDDLINVVENMKVETKLNQLDGYGELKQKVDIIYSDYKNFTDKIDQIYDTIVDFKRRNPDSVHLAEHNVYYFYGLIIAVKALLLICIYRVRSWLKYVFCCMCFRNNKKTKFYPSVTYSKQDVTDIEP